MNTTIRINWVTTFALAILASTTWGLGIHAQGTIRAFPHFQTKLENHHNDTWPVFAPVNIPITEMSLFLDLNPMNQINPNGVATVFRSESLSPTDLRNDSHFLLDPAQFTIVEQSESRTFMSATIQSELTNRKSQ